jgi:hypothetical protein
MSSQLSDFTRAPSPGGFATYLNGLPEARKQAIRKSLDESPSHPVGITPEQMEGIAKATTAGATTVTNIVPYSLEAPALNLWPVVTKFRNAIPRRVIGGTGHHWKRITAIDTNPSYGFVSEPTDSTANTTAGRAGFMSWTEVDASVTFATMGLDNYITFAAKYGANTTINSGMNFRTDEVVRLATLQAMMMREERAIIGANLTALGAPSVPVTTNVTQLASTAGTLTPSAVYQISVSALTPLGVQTSAKGHASADAPGESTPATQTAFTLAGSSVGSTSVAFTWPWKAGAAGYNIFAKLTSGVGTYIATVFTNYYALTTLTPGTQNTNVVNTVDLTADTAGFDGLIKLFVANGGYVAQLGGATGATWTSTPTVSGATNIDQFDAAFLSFFTNYSTGPQRIFINAVDQQKITAAIAGATITSGTTPYLRFDMKGGDGNFTGGMRANAVFNQYTGENVDLIVHPYVPQGTAIMWCDKLGEYYPDSKIPNPVEMLLAYDYMNIEWARTSLREEFGIYFCGAPALRAGFPMGIIQGAK